ncbi:Ig-like domain-containing protein [Cellulomonas sp. NS3]|uniref:Ig-like domain-containing protein n=1 Tax=Cellulomonas sp. NS3 TaxID=2973977 RepID=UPI002163C061|nr:Ig-like domain-containing protein [Cellulomonas sp. NS3]
MPLTSRRRPAAPTSWRGRRALLVAVLVALVAPVAAAPVSAESGTVSGRVILPAGVDPARVTDVMLWAHPVDGVSSFFTRPSADGTYELNVNVPSVISVVPPADVGLVHEYYGGAHQRSKAQVVQPGPDRTGLDVTLDVGGTIHGRLTVPPGYSSSQWYVRSLNVDDRQSGSYESPVGADGSYVLRALPTGRYRLEFNGPGFEYWKDSATEEGATLVPVTLGRATTGVDPVVKVTTYLSARVEAAIVPPGTPVRVSVQVGARDSTVPGGTVEVVDGSGRVVGRASPVSGAADVSVTGLPAAQHHLRVRFLGDATYEASEGAVDVWVSETEPLTVTRIAPSTGPARVRGAGNVWVDVVGTGFTAGTTALVAGQPVSTTVVSPTALRAWVPRGEVGTVDVTVRDGATTSASAAPLRWATAVGTPPTRILDGGVVGPNCASVGVADVPIADVTGVWLNVTVVSPAGPGYVVVGPASSYDGTTWQIPELSGSTVNFEPGQDVANSAYVPISRDGRVCYGSAGAPVRVLLDLTGYTLAGSGVTAAPSTRILDTRPGGVGAVRGPVAPRTLQTVAVAGRAGVPANATSVMLNVTVTGPTEPGNLRVFPGGQAVPSTSVVNFAPGQDKANATTVQLVDGAVSFWSDTSGPGSTNPVHVILDVVGWTTPGSALTSVAPTRVIDTRGGSRVGPIAQPLHPRAGTSFSVVESGAVPAGATAVLLNVTAVGPRAPGNLRVYPDDDGTGRGAPPNASVLNYIVGRDIPNQVLVALPSNGRVTLYSDSHAGTTDALVDVVGYVR